MVRGLYDIPLDEEREHYERGIAHFNSQEFFEAHETWENAWRGTSGRRCQFYQGLIQMAVVLVHYQRQNPVGARTVFERACGKWAGLPDVYMGLDLRSFGAKMRAILGEMLTSPPGRLEPSDASRFFEMRLEYDPFVDPREESAD